MTLQRRLVLTVLLAAPLAWLLTIAATYWFEVHEVNEIYDTDMVRVAQQLRAAAPVIAGTPLLAPEEALPGNKGEAGLGDIAVAIWRRDGSLLAPEAQNVRFPLEGDTEGFVNVSIGGVPWRLYYLSEPRSGARVAVGQRLGERKDLVYAYITSLILPWLLGLPVSVGLLVVAVRRALRPVRILSAELEHRTPDDAVPLHAPDAPKEIQPLIRSMNGLLGRVAAAIVHERRLTADAAHELRTPLAAMKVHWDLARKTPDVHERQEALDSVNRGIERLDRLVSQLLTMARLDSAARASLSDVVNWPEVAGQAISDCLWLADRRDIDVEVDWPAEKTATLPMVGDREALAIMLKNLLDNAIRYSRPSSTVKLAFALDRIVVDDQGSGVSTEDMARLGNRFFRVPGNTESGSGLGLSIASHIARNHGLTLCFENRFQQNDGERGLRIIVRRDIGA